MRQCCVLSGPMTVYVPKFRSRRTSARRRSQRQSALDELAEETAAVDSDAAGASKRASAPVRLSPDVDQSSPDESTALLTQQKPAAASFDMDDDDDKPQRSQSQKGRGKLQRQDESIV